MKTSKYNALAEFNAAPFSVSGLKANSPVKSLISTILSRGEVRTGYYQGRGRHTKAVDLTYCVTTILDLYDIAYETGNDAPRGGVCGKFVKVTSPAFLKEVRAVMERENAQAEAAKEEHRRQAEAYKRHIEWVEDEASRLDLNPYMEEIKAIYEENWKKVSYWSNLTYPTQLSRKEIGKICWELTHRYKGFNTEVLKKALQSLTLK